MATSHPEIDLFVGRELQGHVASVVERFKYGYIALNEQPGIQFIVKTDLDPTMKPGDKLSFTIDDGGAVNQLQRVKATTATAVKAPVISM